MIDVKQSGVILVVIFVIEVGHLHSLCGGRDDVILSGFPDSSPRSVKKTKQQQKTSHDHRIKDTILNGLKFLNDSK